MGQIGFSLVDSNGKELQGWGQTLGCISTPDRIVLPNGDIVQGFPGVSSVGEWRIVPRIGVRGNAGIVWDGNNIVVHFPVTPDDIRAEAQRRIIQVVGAKDLSSCIVKQLNALMRATELANKKHTSSLTEQEEAEAAALQNMAEWIKFIRARSNHLEVSLPVDFTNDAHWA